MEEIAIKTAEPALSTLAQSLIGSLIILSVFVAIASIYLLTKIQNARVDDQKELSGKLETANLKMIVAFEKFQGVLNSLERAEVSSTSAIYSLRDQVVVLGSKIDSCPRR